MKTNHIFKTTFSFFFLLICAAQNYSFFIIDYTTAKRFMAFGETTYSSNRIRRGCHHRGR